MLRPLVLASMFLAGALCSAQAPPQAATPEHAPAGQTPEEIFSAAKKQMQLPLDGTAPFELHASFTNKQDGKVVETGTYRQIWRSPSTWRVETTVSGAKRIEICNNGSYSDQGAEKTPEGSHMRYIVTFWMHNLLPLFPDHAAPDRWTISPATLGGMPFTRVALNFPATRDSPAAIAVGYYFTPGTTRLRVLQIGSTSFLYDDLRPLESKLVARKVTNIRGTTQEVVTQIDSLTLQPSIEDRIFNFAHASADTCPGILPPSADLIYGEPTKPIVPLFPPQARGQYKEWRTWVRVTIDKDGVPRNPVPLVPRDSTARNSIFNNAALDAVRESRWQPSLRDGEPVEITTTVPVDFH